MALPTFAPMLASTQPPTAGAAFEPKLDGSRALVYVDGAVTVRTPTGRDITEYVDRPPGFAASRRTVAGMIGVGFGLFLAGIFGIVLSNVGPRSDLWWPDRPYRLPSTRSWVIVSAVGVGLIILGGFLTR